MDNINIVLRRYTIILLISTLSLIAGSNTNCNGKAFHCVNSTHFKICVDLGGGVSTTVDEFLIPCPENTVCKQYNLFECEYELTTTLPPVTIQSEVTNEQFKTIDSSVREQLDKTTLFPAKQQEGMELSKKYYNKVNATAASFTERFLTDALIDSVNTSNANDLHTSSKGDIIKTLNISRSTDKELTSITESGIDVTQRSLYNINTLVTDAGVSSKYNTETPILFSTTQDRRTIDSIKNESMEPLNQNSSDLDASYTVKKRYSAVTLLPGNFSVPSLQENTSGISNIHHLIKSDNTSQDNLDILTKYNSTQLNNSDNTQYRNINNSMYSKNTSTDINTLNTTPFNVITDEIFTSGVSDINKKSKVNSVITLKSSRQHLAEITTASSIIVPGTTNQFSSHISLNTEVIETFFNDGLNITTNLEKISVSDGDIMTSTSFIPETSVAKINDTSSQITKSGFNDGLSSVTLTKPVLDKKNDTSSNKPLTSDTKLRSGSEILNLKNEFKVNFTTELISVNNSQYLTTTEPYFHDKSDIPMSSTSKSEVTSPINIRPFRSMEATQVHNASQINNVNKMESELVSTKILKNQSNSSFLPRSNFSLFTTAVTKTAKNDKIIVGDYNFTRVDMLPILTTAEMSNGATSLKPLRDLILENKLWPESVIVIDATGLENNDITTKEESNNITTELSNGITSLKPISDLISKNETSSKSATVTVGTDLDNNNMTAREENNNRTTELSNGITSLKPISDLISKNETSSKSATVTVGTDLDNNNMTAREENNNRTTELSNGITSLKPISDLISKNETSSKLATVTVTTDLDNNNTTITEESNNITGEISNGVPSLKSMSDLISKNKTSPKSVTVTVATDLDNNHTTITEKSNNRKAEISNGVTSLKPISDLISKSDNNKRTTAEVSNNITTELYNGVTSLKPISDLISKNETGPKPAMVTVAIDLDNNNITTTEKSSNITAEISNGVTSFTPISVLISNNETRPKPVMVTVATDLDNNHTKITEKSNNLTGEISKGVTSLKSISDLNLKNETSPKPVIVTVATDLDNNNSTITEESYNTTGKISKGVTSLKSISDLNSKNKTSPKPVIVTVATDLDNNNSTITEESYNTTGEISKGVMSLKSILDLNSKNDTSPKPVIVTVATDFDNNNSTITEKSYNTTGEISKGVTSLKSISDSNSMSDTSPKPVIVTVATDLDNNNSTITEESYNTTGKISEGGTSLKSISDLNSMNDTSPKPVIVTVATDLDNNNSTITEESYNTTGKISKGVTSLKSISDLNSMNDTSPKPVIVTVATDLDNNNSTITEESYNTTKEISKGVTSLTSISDLNSKNDTSPKPVIVTVATDLDNNNSTITEKSYNTTGEISKGVTSLKSISDSNSMSDTSPKPVIVTVATDLDNNNSTITEESYNTTGKISEGGTSLKSISDLNSMNDTSPMPVIVTVATDLDNNNSTITEESYNTTGKISKGVTSLKSISDLNSMNDTSPKPVIVTVATDLDNNNSTITEESYNTTKEISKGVTSLTSISDLNSKNDTSQMPVIVTVATDLDNNNSTITEESYNTTGEISKGGTSLKSISDSNSMSDTSPKPVIVTVATDLDNNNSTITKESYNTIGEISKGVTSLKSISDLNSMNDTSPKPVIVTVATDLDNNNSTITEESYNTTKEISKGVTSLTSISDLNSKNDTSPKPVIVTVATDLDNNNSTITEESYNTTGKISKGVTSLKSISDLIPTTSKTQPTVFKLLTVNDTIDSIHEENIFETTSTILITVHQSLNETTTILSSPNNILKTKDFNKDSVRLISSTDSVISNLERNTTWILTNLPKTLDKPKTLTDRSSGVLDNNNKTNNNDTIKPIINSLYEVNKALSSNYTYNDNNNRTSDVYQTTTKSNRALNTVESLTGPAVSESPNSMNVTNNTFIVIDVLSEHRVVSDNNKNIANTSKLESQITTKPSTYFDSNKSSIHNISSDTKNVTSLSSQFAKNDMNTKQVIYKNTSDNNQIFGKNYFGNPTSTKLNPQNILIPKLVTVNNFSLSPAFHITYINNNITDKNNNTLKDVEVKRYQITNSFVEKLLTIGVNNTHLNYTDKNVVPSVSNNFKSVPLIYLHNSLTKTPLTNIYNVSHSENISQTLTVNKTTASNKNHETEDKESSKTNKNGLVPSHAVSIIEHERNKTEYLLLNPYTQVNTTAIKVNKTTLKELTYNFSEPSFTVRNNVKHDFIMKNITTSADKNTASKGFNDTKGSGYAASKGFNDTKGSGYDKSNSIITIKSVNTNTCTNCSKLADNSQLSEISNSQLSGNVIKPLLIKPLQDVKNTFSLHPENGNLFSEDIQNNWRDVNKTLVTIDTKPTKPFTQEENVSEVNNLTFIRTTDKYTNALNATSVSNITAKSLLRNTLSQTNTIKNKTQDGMSSNGLKFSRIPSEFYKSQSTGPLKLEKTAFVSNRPTLEIISEQEKITISDHTNRSNGIEKKQLTNGQGHSESNLTIANDVTKKNRNNIQTSFTTPINNINYPDTHYGNLPTNQQFRCTKRGKFSDAKDCNRFFVCVGRVQPIIGLCPTDSVFSEYLKQCTKNFTHCIGNNQFKCAAAGRFINILSNNTYFICAKKNSSFIRFTFQCQKGYYLDKNNVKCIPELKNISKSDESRSKNTKELSFDKSEEMEGVSINSNNVFECEKEGKFKDPQDCRKYYVCKKGRKSVYRRKIKQCDSDEVFHRKKKKCVDVESYECNI